MASPHQAPHDDSDKLSKSAFNSGIGEARQEGPPVASYGASPFESAQIALPKVPDATDAVPSTEIFKPLIRLESAALEERPHQFGREVRLSVYSETIKAAIEEGQAYSKQFMSQVAPGMEAVDRGGLFEDEGIDTPLTEPLILTFIPIVHGSERKNPRDRVVFLEQHGLGPVPRCYLTLAGVLFRAAKGIKPDTSPGGGDDDGDLFEAVLSSGPGGSIGTDSGLGITDYGVGGKTSHLYAAGMTKGS